MFLIEFTKRNWACLPREIVLMVLNLLFPPSCVNLRFWRPENNNHLNFWLWLQLLIPGKRTERFCPTLQRHTRTRCNRLNIYVLKLAPKKMSSWGQTCLPSHFNSVFFFFFNYYLSSSSVLWIQLCLFLVYKNPNKIINVFIFLKGKRWVSVLQSDDNWSLSL